MCSRERRRLGNKPRCFVIYAAHCSAQRYTEHQLQGNHCCETFSLPRAATLWPCHSLSRAAPHADLCLVVDGHRSEQARRCSHDRCIAVLEQVEQMTHAVSLADGATPDGRVAGPLEEYIEGAQKYSGGAGVALEDTELARELSVRGALVGCRCLELGRALGLFDLQPQQ